jgi:MPBQ/MSBQ methyltransferase
MKSFILLHCLLLRWLLLSSSSCQAFLPSPQIIHRGSSSGSSSSNSKAVTRIDEKFESSFASSSKSKTTALHLVSVSTVVKTAALTAAAGTAVVKFILDKPSRTYSATENSNTVAQEYDAWADDGILEYYWGEHIHLGYYYHQDDDKNQKKRVRKDFIQAKYDFIQEMMKFGNISPQTHATAKVLDVGCGFGGTSRYLAKQLGTKSHVTGITLSPKQVQRGTELAMEQGVAKQTTFVVMDALNMTTFPDNTFDIVWACESGEHMPDKKRYINEMMRVLKPGGTFVMACWSQRDATVKHPFTRRDQRDLQYLYEEWTHPYFISIQDYKKLIDDTGMMQYVTTANWCQETIPSWRHSIWVGIRDPRGWILKPKTYVKCIRDAYCLERMHRAFARGLMEYGMWTAIKKVEVKNNNKTNK